MKRDSESPYYIVKIPQNSPNVPTAVKQTLDVAGK